MNNEFLMKKFSSFMNVRLTTIQKYDIWIFMHLTRSLLMFFYHSHVCRIINWNIFWFGIYSYKWCVSSFSLDWYVGYVFEMYDTFLSKAQYVHFQYIFIWVSSLYVWVKNCLICKILNRILFCHKIFHYVNLFNRSINDLIYNAYRISFFCVWNVWNMEYLE